MNTAGRVGAYLAALAVLFAAAFGLGKVVGPVGSAADHNPAVQTDNGDSGMDGDG
jgi:hypothetical protein